MGSIPVSFDSLIADINFLYLFLFFLTIVSLFELYIDYRQHAKFLIKQRPKELTYVNDEEFKKAQAYGLDKSNFGFISSFLSTARLVVFLLSGVYPLLWKFSASVGDSLFSSMPVYTADAAFYTSLLFFYFDHIVDLFFDLPVSLYSTFIIEEKHGFNKQTLSLYVSDLIKSLFLTLILGLPLLGLAIKVIEWGGPYFYLYLSGFMLVIQLLMTIIYPMFIQPCFNKVEPLPEGELRTAIEQLATQCKFPLTQLYSIDGSKRSGHSNAYFFGFFKNKRIVIYDTLINQCSIKEVVGILGHEIGHWALNHTVKLMMYAIVQTTIIFFLFGKIIHFDQLYEDFGFQGIRATYIGLKLFLFILLPMQHLLSFIANALSRRFEFQADHYSCELGKGSDLLDGLTKLQKENKGTMIADSLYAACHYSHPPVLQRLEKIQQYVNKHAQKSK